MIRFSTLLLAVCVAFMLFACSEKSTKPNVEGLFKQVGNCLQSRFGIFAAGDSCFAYEFETDLLLEFCVSGNCCPDSNRFDFTSTVAGDSIVIAVTDTAANLCHCICPYMVRGEISNLPLDRYLVVCFLNGNLRYREYVTRQ